MISFQADGDTQDDSQTLAGLSVLSSNSSDSILSPELPAQNPDSFISPNNSKPVAAEDPPPPTSVSALSPSESAVSVIIVDTDRMSCSPASSATSVSKDTAAAATLLPLSDPKYKHAIEIVGTLKKRLAYAAVKAKNGWQNESFEAVEQKINEMYAKLPESAKMAAMAAAKSKQVRFAKRVGKKQPKILGIAANISVASEPLEYVKPTSVSVCENSNDPEKSNSSSAAVKSESVVGGLELSKTKIKTDPLAVVEEPLKVENLPIPPVPAVNSTISAGPSAVPRSHVLDNTANPYESSNSSNAMRQSSKSEFPQHLPPPFTLPMPSPQTAYRPAPNPQPQYIPQYQYPPRPVYPQYPQRPVQTQPPQYSYVSSFAPKPYGPPSTSNHYSPVPTDKHHLSDVPYPYPKHQRYNSQDYGYVQPQYSQQQQQQPQQQQQRGDYSSVMGPPAIMGAAPRPMYGGSIPYSNAAAGGSMRPGGAGSYPGAGTYGGSGAGGAGTGGSAGYAGGYGAYYGGGGGSGK
ncbi:hypothetical protein HDU83_009154 [Entophlyctis luteolus]|nr:hypothetical protein HDU83_009154 [Entophlyctis luteolus]KAJ3394284.1 hypothetical protein HDU84_009039 [Entophlyctis sp. JEL0112]